MKRFLLILGFVVFWRQWENGFDPAIPSLIQESRRFKKLSDAKQFVLFHFQDERYTDMHIYRIGEEIK